MPQQLLASCHVGRLYVVTREGDLLWYGDTERNGARGWAPRSGERIGQGWQGVRLLCGGEGGALYAVRDNGDLAWYADGHLDGTQGWAPNSGNVIGWGWQGFRLVFGGEDGVIYAIRDNGDLLWYKDVHRDGTSGWAPGSGNVIGWGWQDFRLVFGGTGGVIYAIRSNGDLLWYKDLGRDGTVNWAPGSGNVIGTGWGGFTHAVSAGGRIYGVDGAGALRWYFDTRQDGTRSWAPGSGNVIGEGWQDVEWTPSLATFGHGSMLADGQPALGARPLLVLLVEWAESPEGGYPPITTLHPLDYYEKLAFGSQKPPFSTRSPVNPASLTDYFSECSLGRFTLARVGIIGPITLGPFPTDMDLTIRSKHIIRQAAQVRPDLFFAADTDGDGVVNAGELFVLIVENLINLKPANRQTLSVVVYERPDPNAPNVAVSVRVAYAGLRTPFFQIAHEVAHCLGTEDLYEPKPSNELLTLAGGYSFDADDQGSVHLDAWHKMVLGWCEPRIRRMTRPGSEVVWVTSAGDPTAPVLLWHPARGASEFFLLERRTSQSLFRAYDGSFNGAGMVIWRVKPGTAVPVYALGTPDLRRGGNGVWGDGQTTPPLTWADGTSTGVRLTFHADGRVSWA